MVYNVHFNKFYVTYSLYIYIFNIQDAQSGMNGGCIEVALDGGTRRVKKSMRWNIIEMKKKMLSIRRKSKEATK